MTSATLIGNQIRRELHARYCSLNLPPEWIAPNYDGRSIMNVPVTAARLMGVPMSTPPLDPDITAGLDSGVQRVILIVVDALGYDKLIEILAQNPENGFHALSRGHANLVPITSVFPSTTTAALTSLWSGYSPAEHGFLGYQLWLREHGSRSNMISFSPSATEALGRDQLIAGGLAPDKFLPVPSLAQVLEPAGVPVYHLLESPYVKSGLSRVQIRGAREVGGFVTASDMWVTLRERIEAQRDERAVFAVYWSAVDSIGHIYGPSHPTMAAEVNNLAYSFEREFLRSLSPAAREGTLLLLTADHGQIDTPPEHVVYLREHPELYDHLVMDFTGDARAAYLYCRTGHAGAVREYIETHFPDQFFVLDSAAALAAGLFGRGVPSAETEHRIGDWIVLSRQDYALVEKRKDHVLRGRHGGLTAQEMLVPLIAARLDA